MTSKYQIKGVFPTEDDREYMKREGYRYNPHFNVWHGENRISAPIGMDCTRLPNIQMSDLDYANEIEKYDQMCFDHSIREW
jgi:hypothetical protein